MKKKIILGIVTIIIAFIFYKVAVILYANYQFKKSETDYEIKSSKIDNIITNHSKKIRLNDLIIVCELRKSFWNTSDISINTIQKEAEEADLGYKQFSTIVKADLLSQKDLNFRDEEDLNTALIGKLCTKHYPMKPSLKNNIYSDLLGIKYKLSSDQDSIGYLDKDTITSEDLSKYLTFLGIEKKIRLNF